MKNHIYFGFTSVVLTWRSSAACLLSSSGGCCARFASPPGAGLSLLILSPSDLENMGPAVWAAAFQPRAVLFTGGAPPLPGWIGLDSYDWVSFQTDGRQVWVEGQTR